MFPVRYDIRLAAVWMLTAAAASSFLLRGIDAGRIDIDFDTLVSTENSHTAAASISFLDDPDSDNVSVSASLFDMPSLSLPTGMGIGSSEPVAVYIKTVSEKREIPGGNEVVWKGSLSDSNQLGVATLFQNSNGDITAGTFSTETSAFILTRTHDGNLELKETYWKDDLAGASFDNDQIDPMAGDLGDAVSEEIFFSSMVVEVPKIQASTISIGDGVDVTSGENRFLRERYRSLQSLTNIDVLVLVTNRAMCESAKLSYGCALTVENRAPLEGMLKVVEEQTNAAMQDVGVRTSVTFVRIVYLSADFDGRPSGESLQLIRNSASVAAWRSEAGADLVTMVTGNDPNNVVAGLSYQNNPESVSSYKYFQYYSTSHEIFHCLGANHNREDSGIQHAYGHGFRMPGKFRTIMSYQCPTTSCSTGSCSCPRIPYLSSDSYTYNSLALGDSTTNNARLVGLNTPTVAAFMRAVAPAPAPAPVKPPVSLPAPAPVKPPVSLPAPAPVTPPVSLPAPAPVTPPTVSGECSIATDACRTRFDLVCDAGQRCIANSDCFDCDPLQSFRNAGCEACVAQNGLYCVTGSGSPVCSSPKIAGQVPEACTLSGGSAYTATCLGPANPPVAPPRKPACFSDRAKVLVRGEKGVTRMDQLQVGDSVLTAKGFAAVISFGHYEPDTRGEFIQIYTKNHQYGPLEITADHLVYAQIEQSGSTSFVPAGTIKVGDFVLVENMTLAQVKRIRTIHRDGIYAPFTESGTIVVNGVVASNYIALPKLFQMHLSFDQQHWLQHSAYAPFRMFCQLFSGYLMGRENAIGFSIGVSMWFPILQWLEHRSPSFLARFFYVARPLLNTVIRIEWMWQKMIHVFAIIAAYLMIKWKSKRYLYCQCSEKIAASSHLISIKTRPKDGTPLISE